MSERLKQQPKPYVLGQTEIITGRKSHFELLLIDPENRTLETEDVYYGAGNFKVWNVDKDKIFFSSYDVTRGVLVCEAKKDKKKRVYINDNDKKTPAYELGNHANSWFNEVLGTTDLRVVARPIPNPQ